MPIDLPPLARDDYQRLKNSIKSEGQRIPILVDASTGQVIDGAHRLKACRELGIEPVIETQELSEKESLILPISLNLARRQLSPEQKTELALALRQEGLTQQEVAEVVGMSRRWVGTAQADNGSNGRSAIASIPDQRRIVSHDQQQDIVARVATGEKRAQVAADYGVSRRRVGQIVGKAKAERDKPKPSDTPPLPDEVFRCIVIDPPWPMKKILREVRPNQTVMDYPTMTIEQISELPIVAKAHPGGCHVYLWVTHKYLPDGLHLFEQWGVNYQCVMTWVKNVGITPFSWMYSTEHVLFGRIGSLKLQRMGLRLDFSAPVTKHSEKPDVFYERVREASPEQRLNMFARKERPGFVAWGNEV